MLVAQPSAAKAGVVQPVSNIRIYLCVRSISGLGRRIPDIMRSDQFSDRSAIAMSKALCVWALSTILPAAALLLSSLLLLRVPALCPLADCRRIEIGVLGARASLS
jgi:hypothetical protein